MAANRINTGERRYKHDDYVKDIKDLCDYTIGYVNSNSLFTENSGLRRWMHRPSQWSLSEDDLECKPVLTVFYQ